MTENLSPEELSTWKAERLKQIGKVAEELGDYLLEPPIVVSYMGKAQKYRPTEVVETDLL